MDKEPPLNNPSYEEKLSVDEASQLAEILKQQLREGKALKGDEKNIKKMIAGLGDHRGLLRRTFAESLGAVGSKALPALKAALLKSSNVTVRRAAAKTLKLVGDPEALPELLTALLNDPDPVVQGSAVGAMAVFGEASVELLAEVLKNRQSTALQCGLASWGLSFVGAEAPHALRKFASSKHPAVRSAAIAALGEQIHSLNDEAAIKLLLEALDDPISDVRIEATILLGKLNEPKWAYKYLTSKLKDENADVRKNAAISMVKLNLNKEIDHLLIREHIEPNSEVLKVIRFAIQELKKMN